MSKKKNFDLYSINISDGRKNFLLPSYCKYNLKDDTEFFKKCFNEKTLLAIGTKAFINICGDNLYFVWEGALRIIKFDLKRGQVGGFFQPKPQHLAHYKKPEGEKYAVPYREGKFDDWKNQKKAASYAINVFASSSYVYLFYEVGESNIVDFNSKMRMQIYTPDGDCLEDISVPGQPGRQMWMDKSKAMKGKFELYALSEKGNKIGKCRFAVLKYIIEMNENRRTVSK